MTADSALAWYVYSVLPAAASAPQGDGVLVGAPIQAMRFDALTVLASLVPRALFDSTNPANRTADPEWMAARVEAHHAVNVAATAAGPCLPLAFGSLFSSLDLMGKWLAPLAGKLLEALDRVAGQTEWVVSMRQDPDVHAAWLDDHDAALRTMVATVAAAGEGTAFLMARRLEKLRSATAAAHIAAAAEAVSARLDGAGFVVVGAPRPSGLPSWTVMMSSATGDPPTGLEHTLGTDLLTPGLALRLSGPWPTYAFARAALLPEPALMPEMLRG